MDAQLHAGGPVHIFLSPAPGLHPPAGVHCHPGASQEDTGGLLAAGVGAAGPRHRHADRGHGERAGEHAAAPGGHQVAGSARRPGCGSGRRAGTGTRPPGSQLDWPVLPLILLIGPLLLWAQGRGWRRQGSLRLCFGHSCVLLHTGPWDSTSEPFHGAAWRGQVTLSKAVQLAQEPSRCLEALGPPEFWGGGAGARPEWSGFWMRRAAEMEGGRDADRDGMAGPAPP